MKGQRQTRAQRAALKGRGILPSKTRKNPSNQARGGWSPFAPPTDRMDVADDVEYDAFDRARGRWITHKPKGS